MKMSIQHNPVIFNKLHIVFPSKQPFGHDLVTISHIYKNVLLTDLKTIFFFQEVLTCVKEEILLVDAHTNSLGDSDD